MDVGFRQTCGSDAVKNATDGTETETSGLRFGPHSLEVDLNETVAAVENRVIFTVKALAVGQQQHHRQEVSGDKHNKKRLYWPWVIIVCHLQAKWGRKKPAKPPGTEINKL